jgi:hypothetical protein
MNRFATSRLQGTASVGSDASASPKADLHDTRSINPGTPGCHNEPEAGSPEPRSGFAL